MNKDPSLRPISSPNFHYLLAPALHGGQYLKTARPMMLSRGRKPQMWESREWLRLSPRTMYMPCVCGGRMKY